MAHLPWPIIRVGALFVPTWAALLEMRYLWQTPHALANDKLTALIGVNTWPWAPELFELADPRSNYLKAIALLVKQIERWDNAANFKAPLLAP